MSKQSDEEHQPVGVKRIEGEVLLVGEWDSAEIIPRSAELILELIREGKPITMIFDELGDADDPNRVQMMLVPRCDMCRRWRPEVEDASGICGYAEYSREADLCSDDGGYILTEPAFGCVRYKPRPAAGAR